MANHYYNHSNYNKALAYYNRLINSMPVDSDQACADGILYYSRGRCYFETGDYINALSDLVIANSLLSDCITKVNNKPDIINYFLSNTLMLIGACYIQQKDIIKSIDYLNKSLLYYNDNYLTYRYLGVAYYFNGQFDRAREQFHRSLELNSSKQNADEIGKYSIKDMEDGARH